MAREKRLGWIVGCLRFAGRFGPREKKILAEALGVSGATISRDQAALFRMLSNEEGVLLNGGKLEVANPAALSLPDGLPEPSLSEWLKVILASRYVTTSGVERVKPSSETIRMILRAIQDRRALFIRYVSRSRSEPVWRAVSPHAVVDVVGRYHARCFDHGKGRYGDFVLTRILGATFDRNDTPDYVDASLDKDWSQIVDVRLSLKDGEVPLVGRLDYGLDEIGSRIISMRKALVPYVIDRRYQGFENPVEIQEVKTSVHQQHTPLTHRKQRPLSGNGR